MSWPKTTVSTSERWRSYTCEWVLCWSACLWSLSAPDVAPAAPLYRSPALPTTPSSSLPEAAEPSMSWLKMSVSMLPSIPPRSPFLWYSIGMCIRAALSLRIMFIEMCPDCEPAAPTYAAFSRSSCAFCSGVSERSTSRLNTDLSSPPAMSWPATTSPALRRTQSFDVWIASDPFPALPSRPPIASATPEPVRWSPAFVDWSRSCPKTTWSIVEPPEIGRTRVGATSSLCARSPAWAASDVFPADVLKCSSIAGSYDTVPRMLPWASRVSGCCWPKTTRPTRFDCEWWRKPARAWTEPPVCSIPAFGSLAPWNSIVARTVELAFVECGSIFFFDFDSYLGWGSAW